MYLMITIIIINHFNNKWFNNNDNNIKEKIDNMQNSKYKNFLVIEMKKLITYMSPAN